MHLKDAVTQRPAENAIWGIVRHASVYLLAPLAPLAQLQWNQTGQFINWNEQHYK